MMCFRVGSRLGTSLILAVSWTVVTQRVDAATNLGDLTGPWQLLVDDYLVANKTAVTRTYHPFEKDARNPLITGDRPWEDNNIYLYGTVLPNAAGPGYRMWYHCLDLTGDAARSLYATSADGIHWDKPNLYIVDYNGSTANNMYIKRGGNPSVMHTPWDPDPQRLYKMMELADDGRFWASFSPDAIHWTDSAHNPVVPPASDVGNFNWDPHTQRYLGYLKVRGWQNFLKRRSVGFTATTNIESWPAAYLILNPDSYDDRWVTTPPQSTHFYGLCAFAYESMYLGFLWVFRATDSEGYFDGPIFTELVSSHDGVNWIREEAPRPPILPNGPAGSWDAGMAFTATHPLVEGNTIRLYYGGTVGLHADPTTWYGGIGLATLRKDGFASLDAGATTGYVTTKKLSGLAGPLRLNFTAASGWIKVEVLDENGSVVPGYSEADCNALQGDSIDQTVTWASHAELPGGAGFMQLRFVMQNASLYSFMAGESVRSLQPPTITQHPATRDACPLGTARFAVTATGDAPIVYQWRKGGADLSDGGHYSGTATATLTVTGVDPEDVGSYRCVVTNGGGAVTSNSATIRIRTASFAGVGVVAGGTSSTISGMSSDGSVVCGTSANKAFIWTSANGIRSLGLPSGAGSSSAAGVGIYNGTVVVAVDTSTASYRAKRWDGNAAGAGAFTNLPRQDGSKEWIVRGLGTNGTSELWIAGSSVSGGTGGGRKAGRYKQSGNSTVSIQLPPGGHDSSDFYAASDNGVYGGEYMYGGTAPGGSTSAMRSIGYPLDTLLGPRSSTASAGVRAISRNGLTLGGWSYYSGGGTRRQPTLWGNTSGVRAVPFIAGGDNDNSGVVLAVNDDSTVAGGYTYYEGGASGSGPAEAFIWDASHGTRRLQDVLVTQYGFDLTGWTLQEVDAISSDGTALAGSGMHDGRFEGWVAVMGHTVRPVITLQPEPQDVRPGATATFSVMATDEDPPTYQWQRNGADLSDGGHYSGATTPVLTVTNAGIEDLGSYQCVVAAGCGDAVSNAAPLTLNTHVPADTDGDGDVDLSDFSILQRCFSGPNRPMPIPECEVADFDGDADVDLADFSVLQACFNGPNHFPSCLE